MSTANAPEPMRDCTPSARLVSMMGTRAPRMMPADEALQQDKLLGQHVSRFQIGDEENIGVARHLGMNALDFSASQLTALS